MKPTAEERMLALCEDWAADVADQATMQRWKVTEALEAAYRDGRREAFEEALDIIGGNGCVCECNTLDCFAHIENLIRARMEEEKP